MEMPVLELVFKNLALFVHSSTQTRALMVAKSHVASLLAPDGVRHLLTGQCVRILKDGAPLGGSSHRAPGERLVSLEKLLEVQPVLEGKLASLIAADVQLPAGELVDLEPEFRDPTFRVFSEEVWEFEVAGEVKHRQKLTNVVAHRTKLSPGHRYELEIGGEVVAAFDGSTNLQIEFVNEEASDIVLSPSPWDGTLEDFGLIYDLLESASGPIPRTSREFASVGTCFTRPICPHAQMEG